MTTENKRQLEMNLHNLSTAILLDRKGMAYDCMYNIKILTGLEDSPGNPSPIDILYIICNAWGITINEITIRKKEKYVQPRYVYMYILYYYFNRGVEVIAEELKCDHASVTHGKKKVEEWIKYDSQLRNLIKPILNLFEDKKKKEISIEEPVQLAG